MRQKTVKEWRLHRFWSEAIITLDSKQDWKFQKSWKTISGINLGYCWKQIKDLLIKNFKINSFMTEAIIIFNFCLISRWFCQLRDKYHVFVRGFINSTRNMKRSKKIENYDMISRYIWLFHFFKLGNFSLEILQVVSTFMKRLDVI